MPPKVLNKHFHDVTAGAIYVGRPSKWGNPFVVGVHGSREEVVFLYTKYLLSNTKLMSKIRSLRGKDLVCWCSPELCHADVLLSLANGEV